jgi:hypothetical protein
VPLCLLLNFDDGKEVAQRVAWSVLLDAVHGTSQLLQSPMELTQLSEPDAPRFPMFVLVAAALSFGVVQSLIEKYDRTAELRQLRKTRNMDGCPQTALQIWSGAQLRRRHRAERASKVVIADILNTLGVAEVYSMCAGSP